MRRPKILTIDEELRLLDWTHRNRSFRDYLVILTILRTGLRAAELRELLVSDLKANAETFTQLVVRAEIAQNNKPRSIAISNEFQGQLKAFLKWKQHRGEAITPRSFLFVSTGFPQITVRHLQRIVRESTRGAFGTSYRPHDLRLTFEACPLPQIPAGTQIHTPLKID